MRTSALLRRSPPVRTAALCGVALCAVHAGSHAQLWAQTQTQTQTQTQAWAQAGTQALPPATLPPLTLDGLPRPRTPPPETGPVVPAQVERWRQEAKAYEYGDGVSRDPVRAAELYCRAARNGDPEAQYSLAWMLTNSRGIERDEAQAAHLFAAAAEQGLAQAQNILKRMGEPRGAPPACLRPPDEDRTLASAAAAQAGRPLPAPAPGAGAGRQLPGGSGKPGASAGGGPLLPLPPPPANAPEAIVRYVTLVAPEFKLEPQLVLSIMATESNFNASAQSPRNAFGLMQLIPDTAARFNVRNIRDPIDNIRGGMAYLRWLMAYFQGDVVLVAAAYNAGERAVERYLGVPPYLETRNYVRRILAGLGGQASLPFDATATPSSPVLAAMRTPWRLR